MSPEKSVSPNYNNNSNEASDSQSPQVKRKPRNSNPSEKENEATPLIEAYRGSKKSLKQKAFHENRPKLKSDFTVDIFTSKTNEDKAKEREQQLKQARTIESFP